MMNSTVVVMVVTAAYRDIKCTEQDTINMEVQQQHQSAVVLSNLFIKLSPFSQITQYMMEGIKLWFPIIYHIVLDWTASEMVLPPSWNGDLVRQYLYTVFRVSTCLDV